MRVPTALRTAADAAVAFALRTWDHLKRSHPAVAEVMVPYLRSLWLVAIRRRPAWADMRQPRADPRATTPEVAGPPRRGVDERHLVEDRALLVAARVEHAFAVPEVGVFLVGWLIDPNERVSSMVVKAGSAASENVLPTMLRLARPDVGEAYRSWPSGTGRRKHGFACLVRLEGASVSDVLSSLALEVADASGQVWHLAPRPVIHEPASPLRIIRDILALVPPRDPDMLRRHVGPAVGALWSLKPGSETVMDLGTQPGEPRVSIVIPIYGRYDLIEHQMALFSGDPDMREAEIIYVIDDPLISDEAVRLCREIEPLFRVPHRVVTCDQNNGFARATNIGAGLARGRLLLLLNSDVMPAAHGWLSSLIEAYALVPSPGALGPRLLFPDRSLQHDGMEFVQAPWFPGIWLNDHPGKGLPPRVASPGVPRRVPAITAAALMISRELYERVGGLDEGYIIGDFEDSDLCLKLAELGHASYVASWIELYHLERQSQGLGGDGQWRQSLTLYNAWRHTMRWDGVLGHAVREPVHA